MSISRGVAQKGIGRRLVLILAGAIITTRGKGKGKDMVTMEECHHPENKAFNEPRNDGTGKGDRICGVCGFTMCEVTMSDAVEETFEEEVQSAEADLDLSASVASEVSDNIVTSSKQELSEVVTAGNLYEQVQDGLAEDEVSIDETGEAMEQPSISPEMGETSNSDSEVAREFVADKIGKSFLHILPVPVPEEELASYAKELSRLHTLWIKTKLDAKKFAKACKDVTDKAEEDMASIAEIIENGTEDQQVSCQWEFDYRGGIKRLRRLDTMEIVDHLPLSADECHLSFDFDSDKAEVQEDPSGAPEGGEAVEEGVAEAVDSTPWERNDERTQAMLGLVGVDLGLEILSLQPDEEIQRAEDWAAAVHVQASDNNDVAVPPTPPFLVELAPIGSGDNDKGNVVKVVPNVDPNRRCCMPADRKTAEIDGVETLFCSVCGLVHRKRRPGADPWDSDLGFDIGEKVDLAKLQEQSS